MTALKALTRDDILKSAHPLPMEVHYVAQWDRTVNVQALSGASRDKYEADMLRLGADGKVLGYNVEGKRARMVLLSVVGDDRKPLFRPADILALGDQDAEALDGIVAVALRLSGMTEEAAETAKADFTPGQSDSSGTG